MNKIEVLLGVSAFTFSVIFILFISFGVIPSKEYPGHFTYSNLAHLSRFVLLPLLSLQGFVALGHAIVRKKPLEIGVGIFIVVWGVLTWLTVAATLIDGSSPYIKSYPTSVTDTCLLLVPSIFLGIVLMLDGTIDMHKILVKPDSPA
jgi:hypothetical protein